MVNFQPCLRFVIDRKPLLNNTNSHNATFNNICAHALVKATLRARCVFLPGIPCFCFFHKLQTYCGESGGRAGERECQRRLPELKHRGPQRLNKELRKTTPTHLSHCCVRKPHYFVNPSQKKVRKKKTNRLVSVLFSSIWWLANSSVPNQYALKAVHGLRPAPLPPSIRAGAGLRPELCSAGGVMQMPSPFQPIASTLL